MLSINGGIKKEKEGSDRFRELTRDFPFIYACAIHIFKKIVLDILSYKQKRGYAE